MICVMRAARGDYPELDARCEAFARRLIDADQAGEADEILVVGHSMGAQLAGQAIAKALAADPRFGRRGARVILLTLGQLLPFYSLITRDAAYRAEMQALAEARHIGWVDVTLARGRRLGRPDPSAGGRLAGPLARPPDPSLAAVPRPGVQGQLPRPALAAARVPFSPICGRWTPLATMTSSA